VVTEEMVAMLLITLEVVAVVLVEMEEMVEL
jgi:hypothetical protein